MRSSRYFISTIKEAPADAELVSHKLMIRAGMIRRLAAGIYTWMPLGLRVVRKIEAGTYERHRFKAKLHEAEGQGEDAGPQAPAAPAPGDDIYQRYIEARAKCGENVKGLSREKLDGIIAKQRAQLAQKFGKDAQFRFRVEIEGGKARLKASRVKGAKSA